MKMKNIAIVTSKQSWFVPYALDLAKKLKQKKYNCKFFSEYKDIKNRKDIVFIISYFKKIKNSDLKKHSYNLVVHESALPKGRGWAPLFWQVLEGKNKIPIVLFEASEDIDQGPIYLRDYISLKGDELHDEIRNVQAAKTIKLCLKFLENFKNIKVINQRGIPTYYCKRIPEDSELKIDQSIKEQFRLLRTVDNDKFPAFFNYKGCKYILKIFKERK